jgi:hypothetical protein
MCNMWTFVTFLYFYFILIYFGLCIVIFGYFDAIKYLFHLIPTTFSNKFPKNQLLYFQLFYDKVAMWVK